MNERFGPNTFERLGQGSEAKGAHIEATRGIRDDEILVFDGPQSTFLSRLKESVSNLIKPVNSKVAVPVGMVILTIAAACSGGEKDKQGEISGSEDFSDNLPVELFDACRSFVKADERGGADDAQGFSIAFNYFKDNPADPKALYLSSIGSAFLTEFDTAALGLEQAIDMGLPAEQRKLAQEMIDGVEVFNNTDDAEEAFDAILRPIAEIHIDLRNSVCPQGADSSTDFENKTDDGTQVDDEFDFEAIFDCAVSVKYPEFVDCRNELIDGGNKTIGPLFNEMLFGDFELKRNTNFWVFNEDALIMSEIGRQYPQEVEEVIYKIIEVTECLTVNQCSEVMIDDGLVNLEGTTIVDELGKNAVNSLTSVGNQPGLGHEIVKREFSRIQKIKDWTEQEAYKNPYSVEHINIDNKLKEFIFHFND